MQDLHKIFNPFLASTLILYPLKTPENLPVFISKDGRFSDVFRGFKMNYMPEMG